MSSKKLSNKKTARVQALEALKTRSERDLEDQIRRLLAKPMNERTHFLRKRIGLAGFGHLAFLSQDGVTSILPTPSSYLVTTSNAC